jgi:hypothetical protein
MGQTGLNWKTDGPPRSPGDPREPTAAEVNSLDIVPFFWPLSQ